MIAIPGDNLTPCAPPSPFYAKNGEGEAERQRGGGEAVAWEAERQRGGGEAVAWEAERQRGGNVIFKERSDEKSLIQE